MKLKKIFPINIFIYAFLGFKVLIRPLLGSELNNDTKLEGNKLENELNRVKKESTDFNGKTSILNESNTNNKNRKLIQYKWTALNSNGEKITGKFSAENVDDVRIFLTNNNYSIISIDTVKFYDWDLSIGSSKIKNGDLSFMLTQLATYIKAGIPLIDSVRILSKQTKNSNYKKILDNVLFQLISGENFSTALESQSNSFPKLLINMIKTSEMTGDLAGTLDEMADYYTETEKIKKQMISALTYPTVIFFLAISALIFIITFVVPRFQSMFDEDKIPAITKFTVNLSLFFQNNWIVLAVSILVILIVYIFLFKKVKSFRKFMQTIYMHLPVVGNVIIYNEVANLTRTFASLLNHNVFITDSMDILSKISTNEVYKEIINRTLIGLSKGNKISDSFKGEWAFPIVAYEMLVTGENTGQLPLMMEKVAEHYQNLHSNAVNTIKSLIEPIVICFLAVGVGFIVLSIVIPMFEMYNSVGV